MRFSKIIQKSVLKRIVIGLVIFFAVLTIVGFFILPPIAKSILTQKLSENLHREVTIEGIKINPYTLSLTVKKFLVKERNRPEAFVSFDELFLNLQTISLYRKGLVLKEIRLKDPYIKVDRNPDESYNFSDLIEKKPSEAPKEEKGKPFRFSFNNIRIENGSIDFWDGPKKTRHTLRELNINLPFVSNIPYLADTFVQPSFSVKINDTPYGLKGQTKPFKESLETSVDIHFENLDIPYYLAYIPVKLNFKILSAFLDTQAKVSFIQSQANQPSLTITGDLSLKKIALNDQKGIPLLRIPAVNISIAPTNPIAKTIHLSKVSVQSPELTIRRDQTGALNVHPLIQGEEKAKPKTEPEKKEKPPILSIEVDEVELVGGKISFSDLSRKELFKTVLNPVDLKVNNFSNGKDKKATYSFWLGTEAKESVKLGGTFSIDPLQSEGTIEIKSVPFKKYGPYYKDSILFDIEDGRLDLSTRYRYAKAGKGEEIDLAELALTLRSLRFKKPEEAEDFLKIPNFSIKETDVSLSKKEVKVGFLSTQKGDLIVKRLTGGEINLLKLLPPSTSPAEIPQEQKSPEKPWFLLLKQMAVDNYTIHIEDQVPSEPVALTAENLKMRGENISTAKNSLGKLSLSLLLNQKGTISAEGSIGLEPISADLKMDLKEIAIGLAQPYFADKIKINVTGGTLSTAGNFKLGLQNNKEMKIAYSGDALLANFSSIDKLNSDDFLKWNSLSFEGLQVNTAPISIGVKGISLADFYARIVLNADGTLNLQNILQKDEAKEAKKETSPSSPESKEGTTNPSKEEGPATNIKIESVTLQAGRIDFMDRSIQPEFSLKLSEMGGRVSGLSSEETTAADVELRAKLNDYAPLEIIGKINPLKEDFYVDLKVRFKDIDLSPMTPYSGKYVGYTIEKGKLNFDLKYLIVKKKLDSQNVIFFDQFNFGERVESPTATKLPVKLAVALLKDRKGEIKLDIPVTGSLDDPKFSIWRIVLKVIVNLITKAAISPFTLLGAIVGGGEELSYVEFDDGSSAMTEPSLKKLNALTKALMDRPALKMDIEGHVDIERDKEGLKQVLFQRKLKAQKLHEMLKKGMPAVPVDQVTIEPSEYEKYLKMAYKEERFPKPRNVLGIAKDLPAPEMEKLMLTHIEIKESDLRSLASQRAMQVKEAILKTGQVEPERIFIVEPKSLAPEKKEKLKDSRVDFRIK
ncbi:MAG: DUF748 domain-containing protein [Thermodesulfobacteriota bacterium]